MAEVRMIMDQVMDAPFNAPIIASETQRHRLHKLQLRCIAEIRLLSRKLSEFHQSAYRQTLEQRLEQLHQRYQFYQAQLSNLSGMTA